MTFAIVIVGWIFSLCLHEFSHALVAYFGGDTTVKDKGYLTFNPLKYTHPFYSLVLPMIFLLMGGIGLPGGAVYIETGRLKSPVWQSMVSLLAIVLQFVPQETLDNNSIWPGLACLALLQITALLLNLIPVPPFDGYGILEPFLSNGIRERVNSMRSTLSLLVFAALWMIPAVNEMFWLQVFRLAYQIGIPLELAVDGLGRFQFWKL
jgi:Zn-dependent protease